MHIHNSWILGNTLKEILTSLVFRAFTFAAHSGGNVLLMQPYAGGATLRRNSFLLRDGACLYSIFHIENLCC